MADVQGPATPPEHGAGAATPHPWWKRWWAKLVAAMAGAVLLGVGTLVKEGVIAIGHKLVADDVLSIQVSAPSPSRTCDGESGWTFPKPPESVPVPNMMDPHRNFDAWARQNGGIPASGYYVVLTLQAAQQRTVVVDDVSVQVAERSAPTVGMHVVSFGQCGGLQPYFYQANLDANPVMVKPIEGQESDGTLVKPVSLPHKLTEGDPEVWNMSVVTKQCTCRWIIEVHWTSGGDSGTIRLDNHGEPFSVSSTVGSVPVFPDGYPSFKWRIEH